MSGAFVCLILRFFVAATSTVLSKALCCIASRDAGLVLLEYVGVADDDLWRSKRLDSMADVGTMILDTWLLDRLLRPVACHSVICLRRLLMLLFL